MRYFIPEFSLWVEDSQLDAATALVESTETYNALAIQERAAIAAARVKEFADADAERLAKMADSILKSTPKPPLEVELPQ